MATYYRFDYTCQNAQGQALSGAQVYVVTQPVTNITSVPPSPLATLYTNSTGSTALANPLITNGLGQTFGYMVSGLYTIVVVFNGTVVGTYADQNIGNVIPGFVTSEEGSLPVDALILGNGGTDVVAGAVIPSNPSVYLNGNGVFSAITGLPQSIAAVTSEWLNSYNANTGLFTQSQPQWTDIANAPAFPQTNSGSANNFFTSYNATTGVFSTAQPSFANINGQASATQVVIMIGDSGSGGTAGLVPAPPAGSAAAGKFLDAAGAWAVPSGSGIGISSVGLAMPSVFTVSNSPLTSNGTITVTFAGSQTANEVLATPNGSTGPVSLRALVAADIPNLSGAIITSGVVGLTYGGTGLSLAGQGGTVNGTGAQVLHMNASSGIFSAAISVADLPSSLPASIIGSGNLALAVGGTNANLSATGGAGQVLVQTTVGGSIAVQALTASFIPSRTVQLTYVLGGPGATLGTGNQYALQIPFSMTVTSWTLTANTSGSVVLGLAACANTAYPGSLTSIVASAPPTLSSAQYASSSTLTGWTTGLSANSELEVSITSVSGLDQVTLSLVCSAAYI